ncbi:NAD-dependent epimerase/dehydratase family protein [Zavarzinia sp.]|uniref:NAD-dependent epimerase/dehydratase family protein n=1 Tax=Zavarzinia sp. TaxID=2027920 RepID=UPI003568CFB3
MSRLTVFGAGGFIGGAIAAAGRARGLDVLAAGRAELPAVLADGAPLGHVVDCIGLTADFRRRPHDTAEAHVAVTSRLLAHGRFDSFLFLSSTRVYARARATMEEGELPVLPSDPSDLYNITKLAGEALCLATDHPAVRVARVSNVYGPGMGAENFLGAVAAEGLATGAVRFGQGPDSAKDYVSLADVARLAIAIATEGRHRLYNVAGGRNTRHAEIAAALTDAFGWRTSFAPDGPTVGFVPIETARLAAEFTPPTGDLLTDLPALIRAHPQEFLTDAVDRR